MSADDEFDDFLRRRRRLFDRPPDDDLEPPAELDRLVLRQAREAIEAPKPPRVFRAPRWSLPVALAATLVLAFSVILHSSKQPNLAAPSVTVQNVSRELSAPAEKAEAARAMAPAPAPAAAPAPPAADSVAPQAGNSIVVDLSASAPAAAEASAARARTEFETDTLAKRADDAGLVSEAEARRYEPPPPPPIVPAWRRETKTWIAEIERLRAAGETERADAEMAEFRRQHRAYATSPDR